MSDPEDTNHEVDESVPPSVRGLPSEESEPKDEWVVDPQPDAEQPDGTPDPETTSEPDASAAERPLDTPAPLDFVALPDEPPVGLSVAPPVLESAPPLEPAPAVEPAPEPLSASEPPFDPEPEPELFAPAPVSVPEPDSVPAPAGTYTTQPPTPGTTEKVAAIVADHPEYLIAGALAAGFILAKVVKKLAV